MMRWYAVMGLVLVVACKPSGLTREHVLAEYGPRFDSLRGRMQALATQLPVRGSVRQPACSRRPDPPPMYDGIMRRYNTDVMMEHHLAGTSPGTDSTFRVADVHPLLAAVRRFQQPPATPTQYDVQRLKDDADSALAIRYVLVNRVVGLTWPRVERGRLQSNGVTLEAFLVDLQASDVVCSVRYGASLSVVLVQPGTHDTTLQRPLVDAARDSLRHVVATTLGGYLRY